MTQENPPGLSLSAVPDFHAIRMDWGEKANSDEVHAVFQQLTHALDAATEPIYVVVDIRRNKYMPIATTFANAFMKPHRHPKFIKWLVIGTHATAQKISDMLHRTTGQQKVVWFDTEEDVMVYLAEHTKIT